MTDAHYAQMSEPAGPQTLNDTSQSSCLPQADSLWSSEDPLNNWLCLIQSKVMCEKFN